MVDFGSVGPVRGAIAPPGKHRCQLTSVDEVQGDFNKPAWQWRFIAADGEHKNKEVLKTTGTSVRVGTAAGDIVSQLLGRKLAAGDDVREVAACVGQLFDLVVVPRGTDGVEIASITPVKA